MVRGLNPFVARWGQLLSLLALSYFPPCGQLPPEKFSGPRFVCNCGRGRGFPAGPLSPGLLPAAVFVGNSPRVAADRRLPGRLTGATVPRSGTLPAGCRRSSPGWSSTGATCRGPSPRPCRPWCRSSPGWSIDRASCRGPSPAAFPCLSRGRAADRRRAGHRPGKLSRAFPAAVPRVVSIVAGLVIDRATVPTCRRAADRRRAGHRPGKLSRAFPRGRAARGADRRRAGHRPGQPFPRADVPTCRPCRRSSPGWSIDRGNAFPAAVPPVVPIVAGLVIGRASCRGPSRAGPCRPWCRSSPGWSSTGQAVGAFPAAVPPWCRSSPAWSSTGQRFPRAAVPTIVAGLVIDRASCRGLSPRPCRPRCRSSPGWSSTGATVPACRRADVPPVPPIVAGLVNRPGQRLPRGRAARGVDRRRAGHRPGNGSHVPPVVSIVAGRSSTWQAVGAFPRGRAARGADRRRAGHRPGQRSPRADVPPIVAGPVNRPGKLSRAFPRGRAARGADRRRAGHRPGRVSRAFPAAVPPVVPIVAGPVNRPGKLSRAFPRGRAARGVDPRRAGHRPGSVAHVPPVPPIVAGPVNRPGKLSRAFPAAVPPVVSIVAGLVIDRATVPTCCPCRRSSPGRSIDRASCRGLSPAAVSPVVPIVAGLVIDRGNGPRVPPIVAGLVNVGGAYRWGGKGGGRRPSGAGGAGAAGRAGSVASSSSAIRLSKSGCWAVGILTEVAPVSRRNSGSVAR